MADKRLTPKERKEIEDRLRRNRSAIPSRARKYYPNLFSPEELQAIKDKKPNLIESIRNRLPGGSK